MSATLCHHSLMKVAVCYQNVGITTVTFLASANESLVMSIPSHSGLFNTSLQLIMLHMQQWEVYRNTHSTQCANSLVNIPSPPVEQFSDNTTVRANRETE